MYVCDYTNMSAYLDGRMLYSGPHNPQKDAQSVEPSVFPVQGTVVLPTERCSWFELNRYITLVYSYNGELQGTAAYHLVTTECFPTYGLRNHYSHACFSEQLSLRRCSVPRVGASASCPSLVLQALASCAPSTHITSMRSNCQLEFKVCLKYTYHAV